jgi:putative drug exporter of the RND superfamily
MIEKTTGGAHSATPSVIERLARTCYCRRRLVVVLWIALVVALSGIGSALSQEFRSTFQLPGSDSQAAMDLLEEAGVQGRAGQLTGQIVVAAPDVRAPAVRRALDGLLAEIQTGVEGVRSVSPFGPDGVSQIAPSRDVAFAEISFSNDLTFDEAAKRGREVKDIGAGAELPDGTTIEYGGQIFAEEPEFSSEAFGFLAAIVILLIAFGSLLAMGLPLVTALFGIACGYAIVEVATRFLDVPNFAPAGVAMVAIGVGIDYALFIVTRFREELAAGLEPEDAVVRSLATAGRSVLFAGSTVVVSLLGLLLIGQSSIQALALASAAGVAMVMLASITLLPALLGFAGRSIDRFGLPHRRRRTAAGSGSAWARWSRVVQRRPWPIAIAGFAVMLTLSAPVLSMHLGFSDAGNKPTSDTTRRAYDLLSDSFGPGFNGPLFIAADLPGPPAEDTAVLGRLVRSLRSDGGVALVTPPVRPDAGLALVQVFPTTSPQDEATDELVRRLRDGVIGSAVAGTSARVHVGGAPAVTIDFSEFQLSKLPILIGAVLALSFLLLLVVFRSVLVPLKAVVMNLLSIGAAYGVVVAIFQWGWGGSLLGVGEPGPFEAWAPMMLFAIVFGLSMDYEVFLLSRVKEEYDKDGDNARAVADGLSKTARLITAAAAIMFFVFGGFVLGTDRALQLFGLGLAVAVLVDATIVRLVLVPATMELLGDKNWWLPGWLERVLPRVSIEGRPPGAEIRRVAARRATSADGAVTRPIAYWLRKADDAINSHVDDVLDERGLSRVHGLVLNAISRSDTATRAALQRALATVADQQEVRDALDDLARAGWIVRTRKGYALTDDGAQGRQEVRRLVADVRKQAVAGVREKDYSTTLATLERVVENLSANGNGTGT